MQPRKAVSREEPPEVQGDGPDAVSITTNAAAVRRSPLSMVSGMRAMAPSSGAVDICCAAVQRRRKNRAAARCFAG